MARVSRIGVENMFGEVVSAVQGTISYNEHTLQTNLREAAEAANEHLWSYVPPYWRHADGYHAGWKVSEEVSSFGERYVVHQVTKPGLTHLLENGHVKWLWGYNTGERVPAYPHIADAYEYAVQKMPWRVT